jgi:hypothetical protein
MRPSIVSSWPAVALLAACAAHSPAHHEHSDAGCAAWARETPEQRRAAAESHIVQMHGSADAEHVARHLAMMQRRCSRSGSPPTRGY